MNSSQPNTQEEIEPCPICYSTPQKPTSTDRCRHIFCYQCISKWANKDCRCPTCKVGFTKLINTQNQKQEKVIQRKRKLKKEMTRQQIRAQQEQDHIFRMLQGPNTRQRDRTQLDVLDMLCEVAEIQSPFQL